MGEFRKSKRPKQGKKARQWKARSQSDVRPLEDPAELAALTRSVRHSDAREQAVVFCLLDAGIRFGEVRGLRWSRVVWVRISTTSPATW